MWGFFLGLLTVVLAVNCLFLVLLILIQLPKKEAGIGTAFGGAATDALFGAGTGNALTKMTKYSATIFFALSLVLSMANSNRAHQSAVMSKIARGAAAPPPTTPTTPGPKATPPLSVTPAPGSNSLPNLLGITNTPPSNAAPAPAIQPPVRAVPIPTNPPPAAPPTTNAPKGAAK